MIKEPLFPYYLRLVETGSPYAAFQTLDVATATAQALRVKFPSTNIYTKEGTKVDIDG